MADGAKWVTEVTPTYFRSYVVKDDIQMSYADYLSSLTEKEKLMLVAINIFKKEGTNAKRRNK